MVALSLLIDEFGKIKLYFPSIYDNKTITAIKQMTLKRVLTFKHMLPVGNFTYDYNEMLKINEQNLRHKLFLLLHNVTIKL